MQTGKSVVLSSLLLLIISGACVLQGQTRQTQRLRPQSGFDQLVQQNAQQMIDEGRKAFRFDTFGDEAFWGDTLKLHQAIAGAKNGGVGPGVSPKTALSVGLKVDADAIPSALAAEIKAGHVDLDDPAITLALLK